MIGNVHRLVLPAFQATMAGEGSDALVCIDVDIPLVCLAEGLDLHRPAPEPGLLHLREQLLEFGPLALRGRCPVTV